MRKKNTLKQNANKEDRYLGLRGRNTTPIHKAGVNCGHAALGDAERHRHSGERGENREAQDAPADGANT